MKTIQLIMLRSTILDAVKSETFITSNADRATDDKAARLSYHEAIGDEDYVMRKMERNMLTAAEELKTFMSDYARGSKQNTADNAILLDMSDDAAIKYRMVMSDRFNDALTDSLARLGSSFISNKMLMLWWNAFNQNRAATYFDLSEKNLVSIQRCFNKIPPAPPVYPFPKRIIVEQQASVLKGDVITIPYSVGEKIINDVEASSLNLHVARVEERNNENVIVRGIGEGIASIQLYSRHDPKIKNIILLEVKDEK